LETSSKASVSAAGPVSPADVASSYNLTAPSTARNAFKILRAMQLRKPILLEGDVPI
jgi:midasin (ATPase involved in ribosome maturation)